jgi:uncharacterized protein DUF5677
MNDHAISNSESEDKADDAFEQLLTFVISEAHERTKTDQVARALFFFLMRTSNTWRSIRTLRIHSPHDDILVVDTGALLRCMFEAYLQAGYIAADASEAAQRAQDYFDFEHIERSRWQAKVLKYDNLVTRRVRSSPKFAEVKEAVEREYDRVKGQFPKKKYRGTNQAPDAQGVRDHWYPGSLFDIAQSLGKTDEYDTLLTAFHGCVHSSASALKPSWLPIPSAKHVIMWATSIAARTVRLNVDHDKIKLSDLHTRILDLLCRPYLALGPPE